MLKKNPKAAHEAKEYKWPEIENLPWPEIESIARLLTSGYHLDDGNGRRSSHYLSDDPRGDSWTERYARKAMAHLLRSGLPLTQDFREYLAALFDPDDNTHPAIDRKLIFKPRKRPKGHPRDYVRDSAIAEFIYNDIRASHGEGDTIEKAKDHFGMERKVIEKIWYGNKNRPGYRKTFERYFGPLPKQKRGPKKNRLL